MYGSNLVGVNHNKAMIVKPFQANFSSPCVDRHAQTFMVIAKLKTPDSSQQRN
jgi:hypothetical protein